MKYTLTMIILCQHWAARAQPPGVDTPGNIHRKQVELSGKVSFSRIGFSPVPSFSFDDPMGAIFLTISCHKLSYEPSISMGLNGRPWIIENWLKYKLLNQPSYQVRIGVNGSLFFKYITSSHDENRIEANRNLTIGLFGDFLIANNWPLKITYWYNQRFDNGTISGHFIDLTGFISNLGISKKLILNLKPELFYFNNTGKVDGFFISAYASLEHRCSPFSIFGQGVQPVITNFTGADFKFNTGIIYQF